MATERTELSNTARERLSRLTLSSIAPDVETPAYDVAAAGIGIVHLGVGAFMRAHVAVYCDDAMAESGGDWRIAGVSLRSAAVRDQLQPQDGLYAMAVRDSASTAYRVIGAIDSVTVAPEDPSAVVELLALPSVRVVTLTVTEKGYCLDPASGDLQLTHPLIAHDLAHPDAPQSTTGFLVAGLRRRFERDAGPVTIVSCDNLPGNGSKLQQSVLTFAAEVDGPLHDWIEHSVAFPHTMVDRIVPATAATDRENGERMLGVYDAALVCTEPFSQWVVEDRFVRGRPMWEAGGALFVPEVAPYESAKLRLLNGPHSTIAYLGYLAGYPYVHDVMQQKDFVLFIRYLMTTEISPVTPEPDGMRHATYIDALLARFANASLNHRTWQIAMDGSQKLPQRLLASLRLQLERGGPIAGLALAVAGWMRYALGQDDAGNAIDVSDPLRERFAAIAAQQFRETDDIVGAFLGIRDVFGTDLGANRRFHSVLVSAFDDIATRGAAGAVRHFIDVEQLAR